MAHPTHPWHRQRLRLLLLVIGALAAISLACGPTIVLFATPPAPVVLATPTPYIPAAATATPTMPPAVSPAMTPTLNGLPVDGPRIFPGPLHYEGDVLSIELPAPEPDDLPRPLSAMLLIDGQPIDILPARIDHPILGGLLLFADAWDSAGQVGLHDLRVELPTDIPGRVRVYSTAFEILPAEDRPLQEREAEWQQTTTGCCVFHYLSDTAAARDIDLIARQAEAGVAAVEARFPDSLAKPVPIALIDNMWGNGAYANNREIVISYVDRAYNGSDVGHLIQHEVVHYAAFPLSRQTATILVEGTAVYLTGGHYKPEPIAQRAAALLALDRYVPLGELAAGFRDYQHEAAYVEAAGLVAYLVETYGWETFLDLYAADVPGVPQDEWLDGALQQTYGVDLEAVERAYLAWLQAYDPGEQITDLRLTIDLYDTMRTYQARYAAYQQLPPIAEAIEANLTASFIREATAPPNLALETMLVAAQEALREGRYDEAEMLQVAVRATLEDGDFSRWPVSTYLAVAGSLLDLGYEVQTIHVAGGLASVEAIRTWPRLEALTLFQTGENWQLLE